MIMDSDAQQIPIQDYEKNLRELTERLHATNARLIWASSTPVPEGTSKRREADVLAYNAAARKIMGERGISINDLHRFIVTHPEKELLQLPANVHFRAEGSVGLADEVATAILAALEGA